MTSSRRRALAAARGRLEAAGVDDAALEAELLLRHTLGVDRARLLADLDAALTDEDARRFEALIERRSRGEPSAYITGRREFWGLDLLVTPATLIPRPETEGLVHAALDLARRPRSRTLRLVDVGTGSGAVALALASELPAAEVYATDVSPDALAVARQNARRLGLEQRVAFRRCYLLEGLDRRVDLIVANLPYVTSGDWASLPREIREHEPRLALEAGEDGLDLLRALLRQAGGYLRPGGAVCLEFGMGQAEALQELAAVALPGAGIHVLPDFAGIPRVLVADSSPE